MYWPIGAPQVYSLEKQAHQNRHAVLHDDAGNFAINDDEDASDSAVLSGDDRSENGRTPLTAESRARQTRTGRGRHGTESPTGRGREEASWLEEEIVDIKGSKNGRVFATVTASTVTVWQSRVSHSNMLAVTIMLMLVPSL